MKFIIALMILLTATARTEEKLDYKIIGITGREILIVGVDTSKVIALFGTPKRKDKPAMVPFNKFMLPKDAVESWTYSYGETRRNIYFDKDGKVLRALENGLLYSFLQSEISCLAL